MRQTQQCVYLRSRAFAFALVCEYCSRSTACTNVRVHTLTYVYIYIYTQLGPGLVPDPVVPPRRAGSSPIAYSVPAAIGVPLARLRHQPGCVRLARRPTGRDQLDPRSERPFARSMSYASLNSSFARIVCACIYIHVYTHALVSV